MLCRVFGVDDAGDPDISYVLTSDNFLKMMAIHMRFRYKQYVFYLSILCDIRHMYVCMGKSSIKMLFCFRCDIPVVIMGETGCGKTRLIRYMCDLQTCNNSMKNLVMLKVVFL